MQFGDIMAQGLGSCNDGLESQIRPGGDISDAALLLTLLLRAGAGLPVGKWLLGLL